VAAGDTANTSAAMVASFFILAACARYSRDNKPGKAPRHRPIAALARMSQPGKPSRSRVCSWTAFVGRPIAPARASGPASHRPIAASSMTQKAAVEQPK